MRKLIAVLLIATGLAACQRDEVAQPVEPAAQPESSAPGEQAPPAPAPVALSIPSELSLGVETHVRAIDHPVNKLGRTRTRVIAEYLDVDFDSARAQATSAMEAAGFKSLAEINPPSGNVILRFTKAGYGAVNLTISPKLVGKARDPAAKGMLIIDAPALSGAAG